MLGEHGVRPDAAPAAVGRPHSRVSLSVVVMTAGPGERVAATLELLRPIAQEIVVAVDDRADESVFVDVATIADRVIAYPFAEPVDRPLPWLFDECRSEWMLTLDDDEVPSFALLDLLPSLLEDDRVVHYALSRRWVFPTTATYLDEPPWQPDYQLRLFRTDPRLIRFSDELHVPIVPRGPGRFVREPIWHLDTILRDRERRLEKAHRYESMRAGMRAAGRALNYAFYVPESRPEARLSPIADDERALLELVLSADRPGGVARTSVETVTREQIDAVWPSHRSELSGTLRLVEEPRPFFAGEERAVDVIVHNTGGASWHWGRAALATIRCASRWDDEERAAAVWTPLPAPVAPGEAVVVPVHIRAPARPGRHRLVLDLVHEDVRWLGCDVTCEVEVRPQRRVAFFAIGDDAVRDLLATDPDVEPVVLVAEPRSAYASYRQAPSPWLFLTGETSSRRPAFAVMFLVRALRLLLAARSGEHLPRGGRVFLDTLATCERLVVGARVRQSTRREQAARALVIATARLLGVPVGRDS